MCGFITARRRRGGTKFVANEFEDALGGERVEEGVDHVDCARAFDEVAQEVHALDLDLEIQAVGGAGGFTLFSDFNVLKTSVCVGLGLIRNCLRMLFFASSLGVL